MLARLDTLRNLFTAAFFLVLIATVARSHGAGAELLFLVIIAAVVLGLPLAREAWARRKLRLEGERLASLLRGEGRAEADAYEMRIGGRVARFSTLPVENNKRASVVTVDSASRYFGLNVAHQTSMTEASVLKGNAMDLEVGHPILDPALAIEGGPAAAVRNVLLDPRVLPALLELADRKSLRITTRDGLVRVYHGAGDRNEAVVQLALGLAAASQEHASTASAADGDAEWQRFRSLEERRAENQELTKAWGSQGIALLLAVMVAFKATHVFNGKMNLGPIEILALVLGGIGLPHYTAAVVGMIGVAWFGFAIPATVHFAKLVRSATFPRKSPAWSFVFAPFLLICAIVTYQAEAAEPVAAATVPTPSHAASVKAVTPAQGKPKPVSKPSPGTVHDTEKRAFHVSCPKGSTALDACDVKGATPDVRPQSKPKPYGGDPAFFLTRSAIISVCDGNRNGGSTPWGPSGCRPIACSTSDDCPHSDRETGATVCSQGLCQATMGKLSATDVESLCMAGVGPALDGPEVDPRVALAKSACGGSTCAIAPECRQP